jgi:hypothetical protein
LKDALSHSTSTNTAIAIMLKNILNLFLLATLGLQSTTMCVVARISGGPKQEQHEKPQSLQKNLRTTGSEPSPDSETDSRSLTRLQTIDSYGGILFPTYTFENHISHRVLMTNSQYPFADAGAEESRWILRDAPCPQAYEGNEPLCYIMEHRGSNRVYADAYNGDWTRGVGVSNVYDPIEDHHIWAIEYQLTSVECPFCVTITSAQHNRRLFA